MAEIRCLNDAHGKNWSAINGDCVEVARQMPSASVDFSIYSPPFASIFVYSSSEADMGNCANDDEFRAHYQFLINEMYRLHKPGCLTAVHCSDLPSTKWKDGEIGLKDFMGDIVQAHKNAGWILHSRVTIWRDPVVEMTRTKALGLLYKQVTKDSSRSRVGMPDYLCVFRKPGERFEPVEHRREDFPVESWQKLASPVWMDINQTRTLNSSSETGVALSKDADSERHLCPLQLDVIENALFLWSNIGDVVFSPFMGIGSEGAMSIKHSRKFIGTELKPEYWSQASKHLAAFSNTAVDLFSQASA
jgi:DNA modification methylase